MLSNRWLISALKPLTAEYHKNGKIADAVAQLYMRQTGNQKVKVFEPPVRQHSGLNLDSITGFHYSKNLVKRPLKNRLIKIFMSNGSLMKVYSIRECSLSALLLTCIK